MTVPANDRELRKLLALSVQDSQGAANDDGPKDRAVRRHPNRGENVRKSDTHGKPETEELKNR